MFKIITSLAIALVGVLAQAQVNEVRSIGNYTKIRVSGNIEVVVTQSDTPDVTVETPTASFLPQISTSVKNSTLTISNESASGAKVYLSGKNLAAIESDGAPVNIEGTLRSTDLSIILSNTTLKGTIAADNLTLNARKKSVLNLRLDAGNLNGYIKSGSRANLSGHAGKAYLLAGDRSLCHARNLATDRVSIDAGENATVLIAAKNEVDINLTDTSNVRYFGTPAKLTIPDAATARYVHAGDKLLSQN